ncbi:Imm8 family immunity protein [Lysobacter capsici]|uniref:Imm8 family immunity protein n=1 Tax=Lysobacter capsici TaxID=435897 RepID=UPI001BFFF772|nr:Imm8 family immunity protein [Lysobacter capsici]QWF15643.1 immunity 8 family protein [Lysobacter capsici]
MTLNLEILDLSCLDIDDPSAWQPASPADVYLMVELEIGEAGVPGGHVFQLLVATPQGVRTHHQGRALQAFTSMRKRGTTFDIDALLVVDPYDWNWVHDTLRQRVKSCERSTWAESLDCLRTKFFWEYEGIEYR